MQILLYTSYNVRKSRAVSPRTGRTTADIHTVRRWRDMEYGTYIENGSAAPRQGYLSGDYRLFHLTDSGPRDFDPHSHDFCKFLILISGSVD